jgi:hypothetical protein
VFRGRGSFKLGGFFRALFHQRIATLHTHSHPDFWIKALAHFVRWRFFNWLVASVLERNATLNTHTSHCSSDYLRDPPVDDVQWIKALAHFVRWRFLMS